MSWAIHWSNPKNTYFGPICFWLFIGAILGIHILVQYVLGQICFGSNMFWYEYVLGTICFGLICFPICFGPNMFSSNMFWHGTVKYVCVISIVPYHTHTLKITKLAEGAKPDRIYFWDPRTPRPP